ncbi:putative rubrerythrin family protein [Paratrimastix pyriformis]|uniref:Rubrerythrin family protein n=1 Tax=Paratrimastix pyriformis TaxID=342808 RepID=A0ABQ8U6J6_9EUKA|nr:putative rubrerythrin family protein [Paratrimastix pyriformis]
MESETAKNLLAAFAGESQAFQKYRYFAEIAEKAGQPNVARLFRATSAAEGVHIRRLLNAMMKNATTEGNLEKALAGETYEFTEMYPAMEAAAQAENRPDAKLIFTQNKQAEQMHARHYQEALEALRRGVDVGAGVKIWLCPVCGAIEYGANPPERCPVCNAPGAKFQEMQ